MGRKRKINITTADEVKTATAYIGTSSPAENSHVHSEYTIAVKSTKVENNVQPNYNGLSANLEKSDETNVVVRRSGRLKRSVLSARSNGVKPVVVHVNLEENEKELEAEASPQPEKANSTLPVVKEKNLEVEPQAQQVGVRTEVNGRSLEEKVNYLVQVVDEFKPKVFGMPNEGPSTDISYKSLYIQSQKKLEAMMEEHYELVRKLEFARGQIAAYEKMNETMSASRELVVVSSLERAKEANLGSLPRKVRNCMPSPSAVAPDVVDGSKQKRKVYKKKKP